MKSPFEMMAKAFLPEFDRWIQYDGGERSANGRTSIRASIFEGSPSDPLMDVDTASTVRTIALHIMKVGPDAWPFDNPPKIGDKFTLECGAEFAVTKVDNIDLDFFTLEARQS